MLARPLSVGLHQGQAPACSHSAGTSCRPRAPTQHISRLPAVPSGPDGTPSSLSGSGRTPLPEPLAPQTLDLAFESAAAPAAAAAASIQQPRSGSPIMTTGLRRAPLSGGVKTATQRYDLPSPQVAVRNLVEQAQFAHLCTVMSHMHHRRAGYPFGTLVDFASDGAGYPIFCLSPLAIHARNLIEDPRCSLVVQMPGWTGLANARVTIFGDVYQLPPDMQAAAREIFLAKQSPGPNGARKERWVLGNFLFFRMHRIVDIYFVGGFGTVQWIDVNEYRGVKPDAIVMDKPQRTLQVLNETFSADLKEHLLPSMPIEDAAFISIDATGADVRVRHGSDFNVERISFDVKVTSLEEAIGAVKRVLDRTRVAS